MNRIVDLVMLVDDDEATNFLHNIMVEDSGITDNIIVCSHAEEALKKIKTELIKSEIKTAILFLDINMPLMNGWMFLDALGEFEKSLLLKLKVVMVSASEYPKDLERINGHPLIDAHMPKPLESEKIRTYAERLEFKKEAAA